MTSADPEAARVDELLAALRRRVKLIMLVSFLTAGAMAGLAFWMTPIYRGTAILAAARNDKNGGLGSSIGSALGSVGGGFAALAGLGMNDDTATDEALAVLKSEQLTEAFITENNLMPELFPKYWDARNGKWKPGLKKIPTLFRGYRVFDKIRKIEKDSKTGLITLTIDWKDRIKAADWTNRLVQLLNEEMRRRAIVEADASVGYLQKEYGTMADVSTREAISKLMESQIKQQMLAHVTEQYALRQITKAIPADADAPVKPIKILFVALGIFFGALLGIGVALLLHRRDRARAITGRT